MINNRAFFLNNAERIYVLFREGLKNLFFLLHVNLEFLTTMFLQIRFYIEEMILLVSTPKTPLAHKGGKVAVVKKYES